MKKKILTFVLMGVILLTTTGVVFAEDVPSKPPGQYPGQYPGQPPTPGQYPNPIINPTPNQPPSDVEKQKQQRLEWEKRKAEYEKKMQEEKAFREQLMGTMNQLKEQNRQFEALMKQTQGKRQQIRQLINGLKEKQNLSSADLTKIKTDFANMNIYVNKMKSVVEAKRGLWGQFEQARQARDVAKSIAVLNQIINSYKAQDEVQRNINDALDKVIADLTALVNTVPQNNNQNTK